MTRVTLTVVLTLLAGCATSPRAHAQAPPQLYAAPNGAAAGPCSESAPCTPQACVETCPQGHVCAVKLAPGVYVNPEVDVRHYKMITMLGDCKDPGAVTFRATGETTLAWVQDHATLIIGCLSLESTGGQAVGLRGRQNAILDYFGVRFGPMRTHVALTEHSTATCGATVWLVGGAAVHAHVNTHANLNLFCEVNIPAPPVRFDYFLVAARYAVVDAGPARFTGAGYPATTGATLVTDSLITWPANGQRFPP
jgi:hypothetical protein